VVVVIVFGLVLDIVGLALEAHFTSFGFEDAAKLKVKLIDHIQVYQFAVTPVLTILVWPIEVTTFGFVRQPVLNVTDLLNH